MAHRAAGRPGRRRKTHWWRLADCPASPTSHGRPPSLIQSAYVEAASSRRRCGARAGPSRGPSSPRLTSPGRERGGRRPRAERVRTLRGPSRRYCDRTAARARSLAYGPSDRLDAFPVRRCGDAGGVFCRGRARRAGGWLDGPAIRSNAAEGHNREPLARCPVSRRRRRPCSPCVPDSVDRRPDNSI